jgi:hypothetical protein
MVLRTGSGREKGTKKTDTRGILRRHHLGMDIIQLSQEAKVVQADGLTAGGVLETISLLVCPWQKASFENQTTYSRCTTSRNGCSTAELSSVRSRSTFFPFHPTSEALPKESSSTSPMEIFPQPEQVSGRKEKGKLMAEEDSENFSPVSFWSSPQSGQNQNDQIRNAKNGSHPVTAPMEVHASSRNNSSRPVLSRLDNTRACVDLTTCPVGPWENLDNNFVSTEIGHELRSQRPGGHLESVAYLLMQGDHFRVSPMFRSVKPYDDSLRGRWTRRKRFPVLHGPMAVNQGSLRTPYVRSFQCSSNFQACSKMSSEGLGWMSVRGLDRQLGWLST